MKLNKIILALFLICSFSYGVTIQEGIDGTENKKKSDLEKMRSIKNPNDFKNAQIPIYRDFLDNKISAIRMIVEFMFTKGLNTYNRSLGFDYTSDKRIPKEIRIEDTWEDFLNNNRELDFLKIRNFFEFTIFGVYPNGYKDKEFRGLSIYKHFNNEGYYYMVNGYVSRVDEKGVFMTIAATNYRGSTYMSLDGKGNIDERTLKNPAKEIYIENLPESTFAYIKTFLKDYYKKYPLVSFVVKGNGVYQKDIPKGIYISGKAYKDFKD